MNARTVRSVAFKTTICTVLVASAGLTMAAPEAASSDEGDRPSRLSVSSLASSTTAAVVAVAAVPVSAAASAVSVVAEAAAVPVSAAVSAVSAVTSAIAEPVQRIRDAAASTTARVTGQQAHETGAASYYANKFHGRKTASGETLDNTELTMAHRTLPLGTLVKVTNLANDTSVVVRVNDRGPYASSRVADLSRAAAEKLKMIQRGIVEVALHIVPQAQSDKDTPRRSGN
ncbi:MAG: rare lipoprotein [Pseudomonadota bacterium]|nr:rare lipoprotein [Pseudomonadota bacterium]